MEAMSPECSYMGEYDTFSKHLGMKSIDSISDEFYNYL
jgi:hypothetical protein